MPIEIKRMETEEELRGKAYVHWKTWHAAYPGLVSASYLDRFTLEKCEEIARKWPNDILVAKDGGRVVGFVGYGGSRGEAAGMGEITGLYVLPEYWGRGVGAALMEAGLAHLMQYPRVCLWVLEGNARAIRF